VGTRRFGALQTCITHHIMFPLFQWDYSPLNKSQVQQIIAKALNHGSCIRCALCMVQCFKTELYSLSSERIMNLLLEGDLIHSDQLFSHSKDRPCVVCRGLFQDKYIFDEIPNAVLYTTKEQNKFAHFKSFGISLTLHNQFLIRDHLMTVFVRDGIYECRIHPSHNASVLLNADRKRLLKDVLAHILTNRFNEQLTISSNLKIIYAKNNFDINVDIRTYDLENNTIGYWKEQSDASPIRKRRKENREFARQKDELTSVVKETSLLKLRMHYHCPPTIPDNTHTDPTLLRIQVEVNHSPIYISGKYLKFLRGLPQSPWKIQGNKNEIKGSLEEYIGNELMKITEAESYKFDSAGREDIDVRMLGKGRPFVFTILKPKITNLDVEQLKQLEHSINEKYKDIIQVNSLKLTFDKAISKQMREGAVEKRKHYRCVIWYGDTLEDEQIRYMESLKNLKIHQNTPIRVLHRRCAQIREKVIHELKCVEKINSHCMILDLTTSAGTYVKEFIHSDFGRTIPSLGTILGSNKKGSEAYQDAQILQLDVIDIDMND